MALLHVVLDALLPPLLLPGVLVALLEQVPGVVVKLHVEFIQLLDAQDLMSREQMERELGLKNVRRMRKDIMVAGTIKLNLRTCLLNNDKLENNLSFMFFIVCTTCCR